MDIYYIGDEKFKLKGKVASVLMSPNKISVEGGDNERQFEDPGEFESKGVIITGIKRDGKIIYHINFEGLGVVYLGEENNLTEEECGQIDQTDILILKANSERDIAALEPKITILEDTGTESESVNKLSISKEKLPEEPQIVVLK